jgi:hypothetical protein
MIVLSRSQQATEGSASSNSDNSSATSHNSDANSTFEDHQHGAARGIVSAKLQLEQLSECLTYSLRDHSRSTRFLVMSILLSVFFVLLHPELTRAVVTRMDPSQSKIEESAWSWCVWLISSLRKDASLLMYMFVCGVVHFVICDIALVYAFDSLELGSKTGRGIRKHYSDEVRAKVRLGSFGILVLSVVKAQASWALR